MGMAKCLVALVACMCLRITLGQQVMIDTSTCGKTKGCWSSSPGCTQKTCEWLVTYAVDATGQNMEFELSGLLANNATTNVYLAMALSTNGSMGNFYSVACYNNAGRLEVGDGNIRRYGFVFGTGNLLSSSISYEAGILSCKFTRRRQSTGFYDDLTQPVLPFYLLASTGQLTAGNPPTLSRHLNRWTSKVNPQPSEAFNLAQYNQPVAIDTATCGTLKGCWSNSPGCAQGSCEYLVTYAVDSTGENMDFEMSGLLANNATTDAYLSTALSPDGRMGTYFAVMCYNNNGVLQVSNGNIFRYGFKFNENILFNTAISYEKGIVSCKFSRTRSPTGYSDDLREALSPFYLLAATGTLTSGNPPTIKKHVNRWTSKSNPQANEPFNLVQYPLQSTSTQSIGTQTEASVQANNSSTVSTVAYATSSTTGFSLGATTSGSFSGAPSDITTTGCGTTDGCFLNPPGCSQATCSYVLTWTPQVTSRANAEDFVTFQLSGTVPVGPSPYVTMAFSEDQIMGDDYTIGCWWNGSSVVIQDGYTVGSPARGHNFISPGNVGVGEVGGWYYPNLNILSCKFTHTLGPTANTHAKDITQGHAYYLFIAIGDETYLDYGFGRHTVPPAISSEAVDVTVVGNVGTTILSALVKAHATLMIIAWMAAIPVGALVGRHYRVTLALKSKLGDKVWFQLHRGVQISGALITIISFVVIFVGVGGYSAVTVAPDYTHPIIGIIITALVVVNVVVGALSPRSAGRTESKARVIRIVHLLFGHSALLLGLTNIIIALLMTSKSMPVWYVAFPVAFTVVHISANFILEYHEMYNAPPKDDVRIRKVQDSNNGKVAPSTSTGAADDDSGSPGSRRNSYNRVEDTVQPEAKPTRVRKSMLNNKFRKHLLYAYIAVATILAAVLSVLIIIL